MRKILFPCIATAALAVAGLEAATPASAADLYVSPQPRVQYEYDSGDRYVDLYEEPGPAPVYYEERTYYVPPPVTYGRPIPPEPIVAEYDYAPRGYAPRGHYRGYAPRNYDRGYAPGPRAIEVMDDD